MDRFRTAARIFISYSSADLSSATKLRDAIVKLRAGVPEAPELASDGDSVFVAAESLQVGDSTSWERISAQLAAATLFVLLCSRSTSDSEFVNLEVAQALQQRATGHTDVLPIILEPGAPLPDGIDFAIQAIHWRQLFPGKSWLITISATFVVVAMCIAGTMASRAGESDARSAASQARAASIAIADIARLQLDVDTAIALRTARDAFLIEDNPITRGVLYDALLASGESRCWLPDPASAPLAADEGLSSASVSADGRTGVVWRAGERAFLWRRDSRFLRELRTPQGFTPWHAAISADGRHAALVAVDNQVAVLDTETAGRPPFVLESLEVGTSREPDVSFSEDGAELLVLYRSGVLERFDVTGNRVSLHSHPDKARRIAAACLPDAGRRRHPAALLVADDDGTITWLPLDGSPPSDSGLPSEYSDRHYLALRCRPDGRVVASRRDGSTFEIGFTDSGDVFAGGELAPIEWNRRLSRLSQFPAIAVRGNDLVTFEKRGFHSAPRLIEFPFELDAVSVALYDRMTETRYGAVATRDGSLIAFEYGSDDCLTFTDWMGRAPAPAYTILLDPELDVGPGDRAASVLSFHPDGVRVFVRPRLPPTASSDAIAQFVVRTEPLGEICVARLDQDDSDGIVSIHRSWQRNLRRLGSPRDFELKFYEPALGSLVHDREELLRLAESRLTRGYPAELEELVRRASGSN